MGPHLGGTYSLVALFATLSTVPAAAADPERFEFTRIRMGIPFNITVYAADESAANAAAEAAYRRIRELNDIFSDYDPRSEASRLAREAIPGEPMPVSRDMLQVLERADRISHLSEGAFDVTVGPVVKLWRRAWRTKQRPPDDVLAEARAAVGFQNLRIDRERSTVTFARGGMQLDFGAIAKGYACDEALAVLKQHGLTSALVEAGGDLACGDPPPGQDGWTVAIEAFVSGDRGSERVLRVSHCGVATSGDAYQFVELEGTRYSHIVDPRTGLGLTSRSRVTVIARDGATADALASAVSVLGLEQGRSLIDSFEGAEAWIISIDNEGTQREFVSEGFRPYFAD